jgi:DNA-binding beta-propeller fold protein YncE
LKLSWPAPPAGQSVSKYIIRYTPGAYIAGAAGQRQTREVTAPATSITLSGLAPFTLYSIDVTAVSTSGRTATRHVNVWTAKPVDDKRYLYVVRLPKNRQGFTNLRPQIEVFDVANGHRWVKNIPLPSGIYGVRGVAANVATQRLFVAFFNTPSDGYQTGGMLCINLKTNAIVWHKKFPATVVPSPDRFDVTPDGSKIYMPVGEHGSDNFWVVLDAKTGNALGRIHHVTAPHNTIVSVDGTRAFFEGQEKGTQPAAWKHTVAVVDTATDTVIKRVGPFRDVVRPFTINGKGSLIFATVNNFIGFQVGDVASGKVIYTAGPPGYVQPNPAPAVSRSFSHGIAITPDEKTVWVVDGLKAGVHVWDVSKVPQQAPTYLGFVQTRRTGRNLAGQIDPNATQDTDGVPAWLSVSWDGKFVYAESGDIIEVATRRVIGQLRAKTTDALGNLVDAPYTHGRYILEINFDPLGNAVRATDQFGIGLVR